MSSDRLRISQRRNYPHGTIRTNSNHLNHNGEKFAVMNCVVQDQQQQKLQNVGRGAKNSGNPQTHSITPANEHTRLTFRRTRTDRSHKNNIKPIWEICLPSEYFQMDDLNGKGKKNKRKTTTTFNNKYLDKLLPERSKKWKLKTTEDGSKKKKKKRLS